MSPGWHAASSAALATGAWFMWRDPVACASAFVAGTALDIDHLGDYLLNRQGPFRLRRFVVACEQYRLKKFFFFAHSLEWIVPALVCVLAFQVPPWIRAAGLGLALHMVLDLAGNGVVPQAYLVSYRLAKGFDARAFVWWLPRGGLRYWGTMAAYRRGMPEGPLAPRRPPSLTMRPHRRQYGSKGRRLEKKGRRG